MFLDPDLACIKLSITDVINATESGVMPLDFQPQLRIPKASIINASFDISLSDWTTMSESFHCSSASMELSSRVTSSPVTFTVLKDKLIENEVL
jgi:hypothetical protein